MLQARSEIRSLKAYYADDADETHGRFHANESPFNLPPSVREEIAKRVKDFPFHLYPNGECLPLRKQLAKHLDLSSAHLLLGHGSDELIGLIIQTFCRDDDQVLVPLPTFSMYKQIALANRVNCAEVKLNANFGLPSNFFEKIEFYKPRVVFLSYPNNPTGNLFSDEDIEKLLSIKSVLTVIDEAYFDFSKKTYIDKIEEHKNLIVLRSFSKIGLAGLRLGYLAAHPEMVEEINKVRLPYNIDTFAQSVLSYLLDNWKVVEKNIAKINAERAFLTEALEEISFIDVCPTAANFILLRINNFKGSYIAGLLKEQKLIVRTYGSGDMLEYYIRISVSTRKNNEKLIRVLKEIE